MTAESCVFHICMHLWMNDCYYSWWCWLSPSLLCHDHYHQTKGLSLNSSLLSLIASFMRLCMGLSTQQLSHKRKHLSLVVLRDIWMRSIHLISIIILNKLFPWYWCECRCKFYNSYRWLHNYMCHHVGTPLGLVSPLSRSNFWSMMDSDIKKCHELNPIFTISQ